MSITFGGVILYCDGCNKRIQYTTNETTIEFTHFCESTATPFTSIEPEYEHLNSVSIEKAKYQKERKEQRREWRKDLKGKRKGFLK